MCVCVCVCVQRASGAAVTAQALFIVRERERDYSSIGYRLLCCVLIPCSKPSSSQMRLLYIRDPICIFEIGLARTFFFALLLKWARILSSRIHCWAIFARFIGLCFAWIALFMLFVVGSRYKNKNMFASDLFSSDTWSIFTIQMHIFVFMCF